MVIISLILLILNLTYDQVRKIAPVDPAVGYTGRFDFKDPAKPRFMYSGCAVNLGFSGTSIAVRMKDDSLRNWFNVRIDDRYFKFETADSSGFYQLALNLPDTIHTITITRRTEWHGGTTTFEGFEIDAGKSVFPMPRPERTLEFIGNSLTCGYGNEGKSREEHFRYETENSDLAYGALIAKNLNANYVFICRSGIGMYQSYDGNKKFVQSNFYDEIVTGSETTWNYSEQQPDVVIIELGANDFASTLDSAGFVNSYISFVKKIRGNYPRTDIICAAGPQHPSDSSSKFQSYVRTVQEQFGSDPKVHYFYFGKIDANGSDWHPNLAEHRQMAAILEPYIKKLKNW